MLGRRPGPGVAPNGAPPGVPTLLAPSGVLPGVPTLPLLIAALGCLSVLVRVAVVPLPVLDLVAGVVVVPLLVLDLAASVVREGLASILRHKSAHAASHQNLGGAGTTNFVEGPAVFPPRDPPPAPAQPSGPESSPGSSP